MDIVRVVPPGAITLPDEVDGTPRPVPGTPVRVESTRGVLTCTVLTHEGIARGMARELRGVRREAAEREAREAAAAHE